MTEEWIAFMRKETEETDSQPFSKAEAPRSVKTIRTWYVNKAAVSATDKTMFNQIMTILSEVREN